MAPSRPRVLEDGAPVDEYQMCQVEQNSWSRTFRVKGLYMTMAEDNRMGESPSTFC